jgi:hypothetical protein
MPLIPSQTAFRGIKETLNGCALPAAPRTEPPLLSETSTVAEILEIDGTRLESILRRRRSTRAFRPDAPALDRVRRIAAVAHAVDRRQWPAGADQAMSVLLGTSTLPEVTPGLHLCDARDGAPIAQVAGPHLLPALRDAYCDAPVLLFICGDVRAAAQAEHGTGYGSLLVRAGALGYALWMAALAEGLAGSVYGRPSPAVTAVSRTLGPGVRHLFTVALGSDAADTYAPGEAIDYGA